MSDFVADERRCYPLLPLQQAKLADAAWKAADHGKHEVDMSDVLSSSANKGECVTKNFIVPVPKFPSDTKLSSDVLTLKYTLLRCCTNSSIVASEKSVICVRMGEGGEGGHTYVKEITFRRQGQTYEIVPYLY